MTVRILVGDCLDRLAELPDESVHCCITSPPYFGLRDYQTGTWEGGDDGCLHEVRAGSRESRPAGGLTGGKATVDAGTIQRDVCHCGARRVDQQLGLEATPDEYVARMVDVFREVRRVLRSDGTLWLNLGDSYAGSWGAQSRGNLTGEPRSTLEGTSPLSARQIENHPDFGTRTGARGIGNGVKPKDLVGVPWKVAFALQADGWWLRSEIIWSKPNPMPESVTDRPTTAHERVFLLSKRAIYFYDKDAVAEPADWERWGDQTVGPGSNPDGWIKPKTKQELVGESRPPGRGDTYSGFNGRYAAADPAARRTRNLRTVWQIATEPYSEAHFATFPTKLVEPCVRAGTSERGCCPECGAPWERETERGESAYQRYVRSTGESWRDLNDRHRDQGKALNGTGKNTPGQLDPAPSRTTGWRATCDHQHEPVPCTVLDPLGGSGTTGFVAQALGRDAILIELNPAYAELARKRLGTWNRRRAELAQLTLGEGAA